MEPSASARISRRGYYYQDLYTLLCCIEMLSNGLWDAVQPEGDEDVTCLNGERARHCQVKTKDRAGKHWSESDLTRDDGKGADNSILGKLLRAGTASTAAFRLILNEGTNHFLRPLVYPSQEDRTAVLLHLAKQLRGLTLPYGRDLMESLKSFDIELREATATSLEEYVRRTLESFLRDQRGDMLLGERDRVFTALIDFVSAASRTEEPTTIDKRGFYSKLLKEVDEAIGLTDISQASEAPTLAEKLQPVGLRQEEVRQMQGLRTRFARAIRSAVGPQKQILIETMDGVFAVCQEIQTARTAGEISPGRESYEATVQRIMSLADIEKWANRGMTLGNAHGALHLITARCQNRYSE
jgi:hypothetical protein